MVLGSPEPLEYDSDHDAEGVTDPGTDQLYVTLLMQGASPIIPDLTLLMQEESPAEDCVDEAGKLVLIWGVDEVEVEEVSMVPEENVEPIPVREQPPPYIPVCGARAVCGKGQTQLFHSHVFPWTVHQDQRSLATVGIGLSDAAKRRRFDKPGEVRVDQVLNDDELSWLMATTNQVTGVLNHLQGIVGNL